MARYELRFKASVAKDLRSLPKADIQRVLRRIEPLRDDPRGAGCEKQAGAGEHSRERQGNCRIVYAIDDGVLVGEVIRVGHRREVYRKS